MGFLDSANFAAPNVGSVVPSLENFLQYKKSQQDQHQQMTQDMMEFQRQQRLKDIGDTARASLNAPRPPEQPLNVLPPTGLITPAMAEGFRLQGERDKALADRTLLGDQTRRDIAEENNRTRQTIAEQNNATRRDISGNTLDSRETIADKNNTARATRQDDQQAATTERDAARQTGRETLQNTRGQQIIKQIETRGAEDRKTKGTPSPNVNANNPTQKIAGEKQLANQFKNQNPDLGKWVNIDPNTGMVNVTPPSTGGYFGKSGPSQDEYHKILGAIYGSGSSSSYSSPNNTTTPPVPTGATGNKVRVMLPDGRIGYMDAEHAKQPGVKILGGQ